MVGKRCPNCDALLPARSSVCLRCSHAQPSPVPSKLKLRRGKNPLQRLSLAENAALAFNSGMATSTTPAGKQVSLAMTGSAPSVRPRGHRFLRPRFMIPAVVLCLILAVVGGYVILINMAFNTINSVSTPADELSGEALGGSSDIKIDTAPAKTALAAGGGSLGGGDLAIAVPPTTSTEQVNSAAIDFTSTQTPTSVPPTETSVPPTPAPTETEAPATETATETAIQLTVAPTETPVAPTALPTEPAAPPTATPVILSQIERVKNGDFELADATWYLEQGASYTTGDAHGGDGRLQIDSTGGFASQRIFFIAGTTYQYSAWAKLTTDGAEDAQIGITFLDENETAIESSYSTPITVDTEKWTEFSFSYTPPEGTEFVSIHFWKPSGEATLSVDDVSVRSVVTEEAMSIDIQPNEPGSMTILLMGVDARPGEAIDIGVRPDSLMVLHLSADSGSCRVLSIPRDTRTELPGYGLTKVNHALAVGGIEYEKQVIEQMLGITIDHYFLIDFNGFEDMVDAVGGITVNVPESFVNLDGRVFTAGQQAMTGAEALSYSRWRGGPDGDFGRMERQQLVLRALVAKASGLNVVRSINELLPAVEENLRTDLSPTQMASIAMDYRDRCTESTVSMIRLEGSAATYDDPLLQMPLYYIEVDQAEIRSKVAALFEP